MSNILNSQSLLDAFQSIDITDELNECTTSSTKSILQQQQQDAKNGNNSNDIDCNIEVDTHDNLTCRMPQRAADDADNGDDSDSDVIIVSDTSETSSIVSYINPSDLSSDSDDNNDICKASAILETESENDSYIDDDEELSDDSSMEKFVSAFKLKFESFLSGNESCDQGKGDIDTQDNLTCRMPQRAADDGDNGDVFDSDVIIVADTSGISKASTIPESERENDSYIDVEKLSDDSMMENFESAAIKLKIELFSSGSEKSKATESGDQGKGDIDSNIDVDTKENLTGRMPQRAAADAESVSVSYTSETSSIVSYINPSDLDTDSDDNNDICKASAILETESENDSYIDDDEELSDDSSMEKFVSAFKLKFESFLSGNESCDQGKGDIDTHDNDGDNGDVFDSDVIIVADTSDISKASIIPESERENDSYVDVEKLSDDSMMKNFESAAIKLKIELFSSGSEKSKATESGDQGKGDIDSNIDVDTHENLMGRMPQRAAGDAESVSVSDTSETSSIVSYINPSDLDTDSDDNNDICKASAILETESENDSYIDDDEELSDDSSMEKFVSAFKLKFESFLSGGEPCDQGKGDIDCNIEVDTHDDSYIDVEKLSDDSMMEKFMSAPISRKTDSFSSGSEKIKAKEPSLELSLLKETPLDAPKVINTRSGRVLRQRIDHKVDKAHLEVDDDDDDDEDYVLKVRKKPTRKRRVSALLSSDSNSSSIASFSMTDNADAALIYVDLQQPVAIVSSEPTADATAVECDSELKMRLDKFLGLRPAQRRLFNPMANYEFEDNHMDEDTPPSSRLWAAHNAHIAVKEPKAQVAAATSTPIVKSLDAKLTNEMKMLILDDIVQRTNANYFESQTPQHIKKPIDLSGLPSEEVRAVNCQQHKETTNLLERYEGFYNFVDSLRPETPFNMCHPLAVYYRKRDFESSKAGLAKTLFNVLNHSIFHCGLRRIITWKSCMNTPSAIVHSIEGDGQRTSRIVLWKHMKQPIMLVKVLLHEMCHAAAFVYHGETGHGDHCRKWAYRAKSVIPELPQIDDCNAKFKYTCLLCRRRSHGIIKFEDEEQQLRCHYCQFEVNVEKFNAEEVHALSLTDRLVTPFKQFVRENYLKCVESTHSSKMQSLNRQYKEQLQQH
ncbi:dentin sialophosphoprotein-like isoform X2 [Drosophila nasuta]|uniref:dentin sialophosphoprotein-like isoform X2 n=1 Tax=Drosophila nasuta TaxID=42062 RepID=UPI00295E9024|nr:dentin sialophosphoprotein-like isoform X2 [Drosophila nasuta]